MARRKQAAPLQRGASSEVMEKPLENGFSDIYTNGHSKPLPSKAQRTLAPEAPEQAGLTQLVICVGGIYASLYVLYEPLMPSYKLTETQSFMGPPPRTHNNNGLRTALLPRALHLLHLPQHGAIRLRRSNRLHLPP